jgi:flagellar motor switch protein FliN/FliY
MSTKSGQLEKEPQQRDMPQRQQKTSPEQLNPTAGGTEAVQTRLQEEPTNANGPINKQHENLSRLLSMKIPVIIKVVDKKMTMGNILKLRIGSMIQFDKDAYQLIELMVNNRTIGLGQPVKIGEKFGLRIAQLGRITDLIKSLGAAANMD